MFGRVRLKRDVYVCKADQGHCAKSLSGRHVTAHSIHSWLCINCGTRLKQ